MVVIGRGKTRYSRQRRLQQETSDGCMYTCSAQFSATTSHPAEFYEHRLSRFMIVENLIVSL